MGICNSCRPRSVANTAKLILEDGRLEEFSYPVKVSHILRRNPSSFICDADDLGFDDHVSAINDDEELELGHLYFELPLSWLDNPIKAQEIALLAVKASLALKIDDDGRYSCFWWFGFKRLDFMRLNFKKGVESSPLVTIVGRSDDSGGGGTVGERKRGLDRGGGGETKFSNKLSVILE